MVKHITILVHVLLPEESTVTPLQLENAILSELEKEGEDMTVMTAIVWDGEVN